ncbi:MAG: hypothetical protein IK016_03395 [Lachnospiraceae bacterium]|nr:hypothetical protein [Lachnospiraceae bacterium]
MDERIIMLDNRAFERIDDGLFKASEPFVVDINDWSYDDRHIGYQAITTALDESPMATILYVSTTGSAAMKLIALFNNLRGQGEAVGYIEGVPEQNAMGELYV